MNTIGGFMGIFSVLYMIIMLGLFGVSIYCMVLFIKLARRGIIALDIYNRNNGKIE